MALNIEKNSLNPEFPPFHWEIYRSDISLVIHTQHRAQPASAFEGEPPRTAVAPEPQSLMPPDTLFPRLTPLLYVSPSFPAEGRNKQSNAMEH